MLPGIEQLHALTLDGSEAPTGLRKDLKVIREAASKATSEVLMEALSQPEDLHALLGALFVVPFTTLEPGASRASVDEALTALIGDPRVHMWAWGQRSYQKKTFEVGRLAAEARMHLLESDFNHHQRALARQKWSREAPSVPESVSVKETLGACLEVALGNMAGEGAVRAVMRSFRQLWWRVGEKEALATHLAGLIRAAALEVDRVATLRCMAAEALHKQAQARPEEAARIFAATGEEVTEALIEVLGDESVDIRLRRQMRSLLMDTAPHRINALQDEGRLTSEALPEPEALLSHWARPIEDRIAAAAARVSLDAVMEGLRGEAPGAFVAAACLAPGIAPRTDWVEVAECLLDRMHSGAWYSPREAIDGHRSVDVGDFAADRLVKLLAPGVRQGDEAALRMLHRGLVLAIERPVTSRRGAADPLRRFTDPIRWAQNTVKEKVDEIFGGMLGDEGARPAERFAGCLLASGAARASARPQDIVLDPQAPPGLRALLGERISAWHPEILTESSPEGLPICEPGEKVPLEWLLATLEAAEHVAVCFRAARHLGTRLRKDKAPEILAFRHRWLAEASSRRAWAQLREALEHDLERDAPRWQAAVVLALLGDHRDEGRLVEYLSNHGPWSRLDPRGDEIDETKPADHLLLRPLSEPVAHHLLEPFLDAGFGAAQSRRIMARAFSLLGGRALRAGQVAPARRAFRQARDLDPLNLEARRASKSLAIGGG